MRAGGQPILGINRIFVVSYFALPHALVLWALRIPGGGALAAGMLCSAVFAKRRDTKAPHVATVLAQCEQGTMHGQDTKAPHEATFLVQCV
jgi:hypothetical protein